MISIRKIATAVLLSATINSAMAADAPLPAGKPAGTQKAALEGGGLFALIGLAAVAATVAIMVSTSNNGLTTATTTSTTTTGTSS